MGANAGFFTALPAAATSPLALVAYVVAVGASVALAFRLRRNQQLLRHLRDLPSKDRRAALQQEMGVVLPKEITAEQWLRSRRQSFLFSAFAILCVCATVVVASALFRISGQQGPAPAPSSTSGPTPPVQSTLTPEPRRSPSVSESPEPGSSPVPSASNRIPTAFEPPLLEGRTIDACIRSPNYEALGQQCAPSAQRLIARAFCVRKGFDAAVSWAHEDTGVKQNSYKFVRNADPDGSVQERFVVDDGGGAIMSAITCR